MKKRFLIVLLGMGVLMLSCNRRGPEKLTIAGAANVQFALEALLDSFELESGIPCRSVIGSSGILTAQIMEGADYHVFLSADMSYPHYLYEQGKSDSPPQKYAHGILVLWTNNEQLQLADSVLLDYKIDHIAIANPETAPYGKAALEYLQNKGYYDLMYDKLVYGSNISHSNQFVYSGAAAIGFSSKSVVYSPKINKAAWMPIDPTLYAPIEQGVLVIKNEAFKTQAEAFHAFLFSAKGKEILTNFGYELP